MSRRRSPAVVTHLPEIGVTVIARWLFCCYVIHDGGDGRPFVVDLGLPSQVPLVGQQLRARGSDLSELGAAIATHGHLDHVAGLPGLRRACAAPVLLPDVFRELLGGERLLRSPGPREIARILPVMADQPRDLRALSELRPLMGTIGYDGRAVHMPIEPEAWLTDGGTLPGLPDWEVISSPGHTDDSTCLYHAPTRTLLSGDAVLSVGRRPWFNPERVDAVASSATTARLRELDVAHLLPGHGRVVTGERLMERALDATERPPGGSSLAALRRLRTDHARRHPSEA